MMILSYSLLAPLLAPVLPFALNEKPLKRFHKLAVTLCAGLILGLGLSVGLAIAPNMGSVAYAGENATSSDSDATYAQETATLPHQQYHIALQLWQDRDLLTNPQIVVPSNELAEIIVSDPASHPDKVKVAFRIISEAPIGNSSGKKRKQRKNHHQKNREQKIIVESDIYLPQDGQWTKASSPRVEAGLGQRVTMEIPVRDQGFHHPDGQPVEMLTLFVLVNDPNQVATH